MTWQLDPSTQTRSAERSQRSVLDLQLQAESAEGETGLEAQYIHTHRNPPLKFSASGGSGRVTDAGDGRQ